MGLGFMYGLTLMFPIVLFMAVLWVARQSYKADSWMIDVMLRQFKYRKYYAPHPDVGTLHPQVKDTLE